LLLHPGKEEMLRGNQFRRSNGTPCFSLACNFIQPWELILLFVAICFSFRKVPQAGSYGTSIRHQILNNSTSEGGNSWYSTRAFVRYVYVHVSRHFWTGHIDFPVRGPRGTWLEVERLSFRTVRCVALPSRAVLLVLSLLQSCRRLVQKACMVPPDRCVLTGHYHIKRVIQGK
jgi:hypothetical protein